MMVDPERVIFDISSDEEMVGGRGSDEYDWITELLGEGDERNKDDSDDVVVVGEVIMNPKQNLKSLTKNDDDDDDDDCVVLEEDPDKPVEVVNDRGGDDDDDDLLVVSEKGQIACRDYPHPRHFCAKFPFGSTPHERHCDQCHCYVCDTLAPCVYWGTGISSVAHCHATDKDKFWKGQRQSTRKSDKAFPLVTPGRDTSVSVPPPVANQAPGFIPRLTNYYPPQNQTFRQAPIRPCSMPSSPGLPNSIRQRSTALRDKFHNHVVSQQLRNASININPRDKRHNIGHLGPQFFTTRTAFKRAGSPVQAFATDRSGYNSSNTCSVPQFGRTHCPTARWKVPCGSRPVGSNKYIASSQHNAGILGASAVSNQPQQHRQPGLVDVYANNAPMGPQIPSQPNAGILGANAAASQHQLPRQPAFVGVSANYAPMEPEIPSQSSADVVGANAVSRQSQLPRQPSLVGVSGNFALMEPEMPSQPGAAMRGTSAVSFQPQLPRQPRFVGVSANYAPMEPQIPSQPQVSVCANSASSEDPTFYLPYANSSPSQPHLSRFPSVLSEFERFVSSENSVSSQSQVGSMYNTPLSSEAQMSSQQYAENSANSLPKQTSVAFHPEGGNTSVNTTASQYLLACPANAGTALGNSTTPVSQLSNHPDGETSSNSSVPCNGDLPSPATTDSTFVNRHENTFSCQPELCRQSSSDSQNISQHGYQGENTLIPSFEDFDFGWETPVSQTNSLGNVCNPKPAESLEVSRHPQLTESTTGLDKYDDWLLSGPLDVPFSTGFNILSPEAPPIESGFFVDL